MRHTKEESRTKIVKVATSTECDFCDNEKNPYTEWQNRTKKELPGDTEGLSGPFKPSLYYSVNETELKYRWGTSYPDGGSVKEYDLDICPTCFMDKIIPLLKKPVEAQDHDY